MAVVEGLDLWAGQDGIDWNKVRDEGGVQFVICKATEGLTAVDGKYGKHIVEAKSAGMAVGAYHFVRPGGDVKAQAKHFHDTAGDGLDIPPVLDLEVTHSMSAQSYCAWLHDMILAVEADFDQPVILYTYPSFWMQLGAWGKDPEFGNRMLWIAHYGVSKPSVPAPWKQYTIWQYAGDNGRVPGIRMACDRDRLRPDIGLSSILKQEETTPDLPSPIECA